MHSNHGGVAVEFSLQHLEFYVADLASAWTAMVEGYGFAELGQAESARDDPRACRSVALGQGSCVMVLTQPGGEQHPAIQFLERHGDGLVDIALGVPDVEQAYAWCLDRGARSVAPVRRCPAGATATTAGVGDIVHTLVERHPESPAWIPGFQPLRQPEQGVGTGFINVDHLAVCLSPGTLGDAVEFYGSLLDLRPVFQERITVGPLGMDSTAVQNHAKDITLTLIEPIPGVEPGQIERFLLDHGGPGVQHVGFAAQDIAVAVRTLGARGVGFLDTPAAYYDLLRQRLSPRGHTVDVLRDLGVLVDEDHAGQIFQIFTRSTHPRSALFFEIIERLGAETFGSNNIRALFEAVELQRRRPAVLPTETSSAPRAGPAAAVPPGAKGSQRSRPVRVR